MIHILCCMLVTLFSFLREIMSLCQILIRASVEISKGKKDVLTLTEIFTLTNNKGYGYVLVSSF